MQGVLCVIYHQDFSSDGLSLQQRLTILGGEDLGLLEVKRWMLGANVLLLRVKVPYPDT